MQTEFKNINVLTNKMEDKNFNTCAEHGRLDSYVFLIFHTKTLFSYNGIEYFEMAENSVIVYSPFQLHAYKGNDESFLNSFLSFWVDEEYFKRFAFPLNTVFTLSKDFINSLMDILDRMSFLINTNYRIDGRKDVPDMIDSLFGILEQAYQKMNALRPETESLLAKFSAIRNKMKKNPVEITLPAMVALSGYTPTYFGVCYKKFFSISPLRDRQRALVKLVKDYLTTTNYSIEKITELCGFESVSYLIKLFKKEENTTPHQYRLKKQREKANNSTPSKNYKRPQKE